MTGHMTSVSGQTTNKPWGCAKLAPRRPHVRRQVPQPWALLVLAWSSTAPRCRLAARPRRGYPARLPSPSTTRACPASTVRSDYRDEGARRRLLAHDQSDAASLPGSERCFWLGPRHGKARCRSAGPAPLGAAGRGTRRHQETTGQAGGSACLGQPADNFREEQIAGLVPERVVDALEAVEVQQDQRILTARSLVVLIAGPDPRPIGQAGQPVAFGGPACTAQFGTEPTAAQQAAPAANPPKSWPLKIMAWRPTCTRKISGSVRGDGVTVGQQLTGVLEAHDAVAQQAPPLFGMTCLPARRVPIRRVSARAGRTMRTTTPLRYGLPCLGSARECADHAGHRLACCPAGMRCVR